MKRSLFRGAVLGILLTLIASYFVLNSNVLKSSRNAKSGLADVLDATDVPAIGTFARYSIEFSGREDLLAHRAKIEPFSSLDAWDSLTNKAKMRNSIRFSTACETITPTRAIFVPPIQTERILAAKINIHLISPDRPSCFGVGWRVAIVEDGFVESKNLYNVIGEATVDRIVEFPIEGGALPFLRGIGVDRSDATFLANTNYGPNTTLGPVTILHFTLLSTKPVLDPNIVPAFVPGAISIKPGAIEKFFRNYATFGKPVFVDSRDQSHKTSNYPGAISIPFIPSNPGQLRFQLDFPIRLLAGAKFDLRALPASHETPLVVFGNDSSDAAPLWVIRALRFQNFHRLFYVEGGLKELEKIPALTNF